MHLYTIRAEGPYSSGMAVVAAFSEESAIYLASKYVPDYFQINWSTPYEVRCLGSYESAGPPLGDEGVLDVFETGE